MSEDRIAIIGAGGGGSACAVGFSLKGMKVSLFGRDLSSRPRLLKRREIQYRGELGEGTVSLHNVTSDMREAIHGFNLILVVVPAYAQSDIASLLMPRLERKQLVVFAPGACGSLENATLLQRVDAVGEMLTIPYGGRLGIKNEAIDISAPMQTPGTRMRVASFPASKTGTITDSLGDFLRVKEAASVLETGMLNPSSVIHPSVMLLNLSSYDKNDPSFASISDGLTRSASNLIADTDSEKRRVCASLGVPPLSVREVFQELAGKEMHKESVSGAEGRPKLYSVQSRFVDEDVPYGLVLISSLGKISSSEETPVIDSMIRVFSVAKNRNYFATGRNLLKLGVHGLDVRELASYVRDGPRD